VERGTLEIGSTLREARGRTGYELAEVEAATMIPARYLDALEHDQFDRLPEGPYRRSFLREYARFLGLNDGMLADEYVHLYPAPAPEPLPPSPRFDLREVVSPTRAAAITAGVVLCAIGVWRLGSGGTGAVPPPARAAGAAPHPAKPPPVAPTGHAPFTPPTPPPALTLKATTSSCWLLVRVGSSVGNQVYEHTLQPGQSVHFGLRKPLWIRVGAPWSLAATIGSRSVTHALPDQTGDLLATTAGLEAAP
jgi:hypothetical protein